MLSALYHVKYNKKVTVCKSGRELSSDTRSARTLTLDCSAFLREISVCCFSHPVYGIFVIVAGTDEDSITEQS